MTVPLAKRPEDLLAELNPQQAAAAAHFEGPALVIAGAGSGKTRTLIYRIAYLIAQHGIDPGEILAVTFTNKAASEMRERAGRLVPGAERLWMSTFHSAGVRILRAYGEYIGLRRGFVIYDADDQLDVIKNAVGGITGLGPETNLRAVRGLIDRAKSNLQTPAQMAASGEPYIAGFPRDVAAEAYRAYEERKKAQNAIDFGDLITETVRLFREVPQVLDKVQNRARFIHIDEYQDTNAAQYELSRLLASRDGNLLVVGDPDQCLPPETPICTPQGARPIADIAVGDTVCGTGGRLRPLAGQVSYVKRGHYTGALWRVAAGEHALCGTPHHIVLAKPVPLGGQWYVYLMYSADRGYRIGFCAGLNQEHSGKVWLLRVCATRADAAYWEAALATRYGLPTAFARLPTGVDTAAAANRLMEDLQLHPEFPHHRPPNGSRQQSVHLVMFGDARSTVGHHLVQWNSDCAEAAQRLLAAGWPLRRNGRGGYCLELSRKNYAEALADAQQVAADGELDLQRCACIGGEMYYFLPLSHLHVGMRMLVQGAGGELAQRAISAVTQEAYDGPVYDLTVQPHHTYIAGGMLVHNSIYRFRGADIQNILDFQKDYPSAKVYRLESNYRSTAHVLEAANTLIEHNAERLDKTLKPVKEAGAPVVFHRAPDHRAEGDFVADWITRLHAEGMGFGDMAVLYRTNAQSRVIEEALMRVGLPAKIVGGVGFYDRREIKDVLAYARLAVNAADDVALRRIVGRPRRGIGDTTLAKLMDWARLHGTTLLQAFELAEEREIIERGAARVTEFADLIRAMSEAADNYEPASFLRFVMEVSGYLDMLRQEGPQGAARLENLEELVNAAEEWSRDNAGSIADFLDDAALVASVDDMRVGQENKGVPDQAVTLMTLHNAKGLEFPAVFIVGVEEGLLPSRGALQEQGGIEEERRLFYVGITRAQTRLFITAAENRMQYGKTNASEDSRFLEEMIDHLEPWDTYGQKVAFKGRTWKDFRPNASAPSRPSSYAGVKASSSQAANLAYKGGEKVRHPKFGEGQVLAVAGVGDKQEVTVHFEGVGAKKLLVKFANLKPI